MHRTNIYLPDQLRDRLDERAASAGVSRAEVIRQLLDQKLNETGADLDGDLAAVEQSFGVLDYWDGRSGRDEDDRMQHLDRVARY